MKIKLHLPPHLYCVTILPSKKQHCCRIIECRPTFMEVIAKLKQGYHILDDPVYQWKIQVTETTLTPALVLCNMNYSLKMKQEMDVQCTEILKSQSIPQGSDHV